MGTTQNTNSDLEKARYEVETSMIVVHGATITCNYAVAGKVANHLEVVDGHGIMENGKNCAHDGSCIPMGEISSFPGCSSPDAETALTELSVSATAEDKKKYEAALRVIAANRSGRKKTNVPCTLPLLDRWFDGDEMKIVTDSMKKGVEIIGNLTAIHSTITNDFDTKGFYYQQISKDRKLSSEQRKACMDLGEKLIRDKGTINNTFNNIYDKLNTRIQSRGDDFSDIINKLEDVKGKVEKIRSICENIQNNYVELDYYESYKESLDDYIKKIQDAIDQLDGWEEKEYHLITTDSFLVCRCGGIITIEDSGQDYGNLVDILHANLLTVIAQFKEHCQTQVESEGVKATDNNDFKWSSYKAAKSGLDALENLLIGANEGKDTGDTAVYLELICHSYNDELSKVVMSVLALISIEVPAISFLLGLYTIATSEETGQEAIDGISADISMLDSVGGVISNSGGAFIVEMNNLYTVITAIVNIFYVSYDTWIETVKITVFTDTHAHTCERWIHKSGELKGKVNTVGIYTESEYTAGDIGRGLKWKDDPGVYMRSLEHKGDNTKKGEKINDKEGIKEGVPIS